MITIITMKIYFRYFKKRDLPLKFETYKECISDNEVFLTEEADYTIVDCLNGKCEILTYD